MPHSNPHAAEQFWSRRADRLAGRLNFHYWLARMIPLLSALLLALAVFEIYRRETALPAGWTAAFFLFGFFGVTAWTWVRSRQQFCTRSQALVRIETVLQMHNRLSAAREGVVAWPTPPVEFDDGYRANWRKILTPVLAGGLFLGLAHLIPVSRLTMRSAHDATAPPPDFAQVQSWLNALKAEDLIEPAKLQELQAALDKLKERPAQDWYTQGNLEAASSLKELTEQSMNSLAQDLDQADQAVQAMKEKTQSPGNSAGLQAMQDELRKAGNNLASGNLPLKQELTDQLRGIESASDKQLSPKQLQELQDRLQKGKLAAQTAPKSNGRLSAEMEKAMAEAGMGHGLGRREARAGPGGLGGGESSAPLELQPRDRITTSGTLTAVSNPDLSRVSIGETLKVSASAHTVDPAAYHGNQSAGAAPVTGDGGDAVWRSTYDPQEADTLTRFFK